MPLRRSIPVALCLFILAAMQPALAAKDDPDPIVDHALEIRGVDDEVVIELQVHQLGTGVARQQLPVDVDVLAIIASAEVEKLAFVIGGLELELFLVPDHTAVPE